MHRYPPKPIGIWHGGCPDGAAAAWVARQALAGIELVPAKYEEDPPDVTDREVYLLDFSYKREVVETMLESAASVTILDHHQSALEDLTPIMDRLYGAVDMSRSGCMVAWEHFFSHREAPALLLHIEDRDLWKFELPETRDVTTAVMSYELDADAIDKLMRTSLGSLRTEGAAVNRYRDKLVRSAVENAYEVEILGHRVLAANCAYAIGSEVAGELAEDRPFGAYWYQSKDGENWGLRSREGGIDVAKIAEEFGGGGHKAASGFRLKGETFPRPSR